MEFLRGVKERVPKLFFVLNKVDLLTPQSLEEVDRFIKNILHRELGFPDGTLLYHTSAIKGESANKQTGDDAKWTESGLEAVKKEVLDFMIREKYFTLADALHGKYGEAIAAINATLEKMLAEKLTPINTMRKDISSITTAIQSLSLEMESQLKKCAEEKEKVDAKICARTKENVESYTMSMKKALDILLSDKHFPAEAASIASTMLPKHSSDLGTKLLGSMLELANKSIRSIIIHHTQAFARQRKTYAEILENNIAQNQTAENLINKFEINASALSDIFNTAEWDAPQPQVMDIFRKKTARFDTIRDFYKPLCVKNIAENIGIVENTAKRLVDRAWMEMQEEIREAYKLLLDGMKKIHRTKDEVLMKAENEAREEIGVLKGKIKELKRYVL
jgi:hypothetical protein